ncbi:MAG TPA: hypothetical protein DET40_16110 [Lentisphaeria bacterium]|nr:MAG: hypothetical protein A2X45_22465 [Lentisphaerae bacterium GWF2_50_93]HCE45065.1 hypothetical protein [Lentisphaeria bacterium]
MKSNRPFQILIIVLILITVAFAAVFFLIEKKKSKVEKPAEVIAAGWLQFKMGEYKQAIKLFQKVLDGVPENSDEQIQALYGLGCTNWLKLPGGDKEKAAELFNEVIKRAPGSDYDAWSMLALVRMLHMVPADQTPDYPKVRDEYQKVYEKFPDKIAGHEAFIYMIGAYLAAFTKEDAVIAKKKLDEFLKAHPDSPFVSSAWGLCSRACETLGDKQGQLDAKLKELEKREIDPANPFMDNANAYWSIAVVAEFEVGDFETARKYYKLMMKEYPMERRNFGAMRALERMDALEAKLKAEN